MFGKKNRSAEAHSMTEGSPLRLLVLFSLPLMVGTFGILYAEPAAWMGAVVILIPGYFVTFRKVFGKTGR